MNLSRNTPATSHMLNHVNMRWPDFIIIGAMKAGTTTLWEYLRRHPQVFMCRPKEPQFFSREHVFARGVDWYRSLFADARPGQLCGEASTCYSRAPHFGPVARRITQHLPDVKLIYQLRDPVDRAYSHYAHLMRSRYVQQSGPIITFEEALEEDPEIIDASRYAYQLEQYLAVIPREQIQVLQLDALRRAPNIEMARVQAFLNLEPCNLAETALHANVRGDRIAELCWRKRLGRIRHLPIVDSVVGQLPKHIRRPAGRWLRFHPLAIRMTIRAERQFMRSLSPLRESTRQRLDRELESDWGRVRQLMDLHGMPPRPNANRPGQA